MKIRPNVYRRPDGIIEIEIIFPFPIGFTQFRNIEEAQNFFMKGSGFTQRRSDLHEAYFSAFRILEEAELYTAELKYLCQIADRLILQFGFPNFLTAEHFFEEVQKL